jgi:hypothetical protein
MPSFDWFADIRTASLPEMPTIAVMEVTMHKFIRVVPLVSALVFSQSGNAQEVDLASLPSIDAITATTDIRPFLEPGVPQELKLAALRRAWVVDPRIRDFRGLQENEWDFDDPSGIAGFGPLEPGGDTRIVVASVFGERRAEIATGPDVDGRRSVTGLWKTAMSWLIWTSAR